MNEDDIKNLAKLSRIKLSDSQTKSLLKDLSSILGYINQIKEIVSEGEEKKVGLLRNVLREDDIVHESGIYTEDILNEAPRTESGYIKVKKIL
jgi:aspartyl-tRNA(Asn)/glutamyl-tRNA(Gln) amidotransferase subunit C